MAEGRDQRLWNQTAHLLAQMCELKRDVQHRREPFRAAEFNPYESRRETREPEPPHMRLRMRHLRGRFMAGTHHVD